MAADVTTSSPSNRRLAKIATHAAAGLACVSMFFGASSHAAAATACAASARNLGGQASSQSACWRPFGSGSPVNTQLPTSPKLAADNSAVHQHMALYNWTFESPSGFSLAPEDGTRPVYFATASDPLVTVHCTGEYGPTTCAGGNAISTDGAQIHLPAGAKPGNNWDAHIVIIETDTGIEYDFWHASLSGSTLTVGTGGEFNVTTTDGTNDSGDAANLALTAGLLRPSELASGHINHALVMSIPCTNANGAHAGYVWPASGGWGEPCGEYWNESATTAPPIGSLFKLTMTDAQIAASGAPTWEQTIMTALAHYGAYAEDTNGSWHSDTMGIAMQDSISWTSLGQTNQWSSAVRSLGGTSNSLASNIAIPTNRLEMVDPCVVQGTCPNDSTNTPQASVSSVKRGATSKARTARTIKRTQLTHGRRSPEGHVRRTASARHRAVR